MNLVPGISLYNQDRLDDDTFVDNFVARLQTVEVLLNVLRQAAAGGEAEHQVLVGARGMGKTSLLRRLAIAIGRDDKLRTRFVPLRFREEQYNVISLDAFWRNCGEALAEWCEANGDEAMAERIDRVTDSAEWRDADRAAEEFLSFCAELDKRPCLLLDNLDLVLDGLEGEGWALRHVLQRPAGPLVIGAASQMLRQAADRDGPFYEFFHPLTLEPLSEAELLGCMHALADRRGEAGARVKAVLTGAPERVRTLYTLTGGNPRILALIYQLLERAETDTIFADLEALLDQVTPFYKARIEEYSGVQQRAIIDAIALNWDPITSSTISETTGIAVTTISSQLTTLKRDGFVEQVPTSGARDGYQLGERFLNIWYLMRHGTRKTRQRLRWLAIFLTKLFSTEELGRMALEARDAARGGRWHPHFREAVLEAFGVAQDSVLALRNRETLNQADSTGKAAGPIEGSAAEADTMLTRAAGYVLQSEFEDSIKIYDEFVQRFGDASEPSLQQRVAIALVNKGFSLRQLGRTADALAMYEEVVRRFSDSVPRSLEWLLSLALANKAIALSELGREEDAIIASDEVVRRFSAADDPLHRDVIASALASKGTALDQLGRGEDALAAYDELVRRFGEAGDPSLQQRVSSALVRRGITLHNLGRSDEALAAYEDVVRRFGAAAIPSLQEFVARALVNKAITLGASGRTEDELAAYEEVIRRFGAAEEPVLQEAVARSLVGRGAALIRLGRTSEALSIYEEVVRKFGEADEPSLQDQVVGALVLKGLALEALGRAEDAFIAYEDGLRRLDTGDLPRSQERVAQLLGAKGRTLFHAFGQSEEAEVCLRKALEILPDVTNAANLVWSLIAQKRHGEAAEARRGLEGIADEGMALIDAGIELARDNLGTALNRLGDALDIGLEADVSDFFEDILWLLRVGIAQGYGEKLIDWFADSGHAERYAPIHGALIAAVRGEKFLLDLNPEVRQTARRFYKVLTVGSVRPTEPAKRTRKRARRRS